MSFRLVSSLQQLILYFIKAVLKYVVIQLILYFINTNYFAVLKYVVIQKGFASEWFLWLKKKNEPKIQVSFLNSLL